VDSQLDTPVSRASLKSIVVPQYSDPGTRAQLDAVLTATDCRRSVPDLTSPQERSPRAHQAPTSTTLKPTSASSAKKNMGWEGQEISIFRPTAAHFRGTGDYGCARLQYCPLNSPEMGEFNPQISIFRLKIFPRKQCFR